MITIWKYDIEPDFVNQEIEVQKDARILSFGLDGNNRLCFWALVETDAPKETRLMACIGTGWDQGMMQKRDAEYIGTAVHGQYVWHLFDLGAAQGTCGVNELSQCCTKEAGAHDIN